MDRIGPGYAGWIRIRLGGTETGWDRMEPVQTGLGWIRLDGGGWRGPRQGRRVGPDAAGRDRFGPGGTGLGCVPVGRTGFYWILPDGTGMDESSVNCMKPL